MKLAQFTRGSHTPNCSGCPACSEDHVRLFEMVSAGRWHEYFALAEQISGMPCIARRGPRGLEARSLAGSEGPIAAPSLVDAIRAGAAPRERMLAAHFERPRPITSAPELTDLSEAAPEPPSLIGLIQREGERR